jgi:hypothetical protein
VVTPAHKGGTQRPSDLQDIGRVVLSACIHWANEKVEQLAANNLTIPQDAIASLLQRLVRRASTTEQYRPYEKLALILQGREHNLARTQPAPDPFLLTLACRPAKQFLQTNERPHNFNRFRTTQAESWLARLALSRMSLAHHLGCCATCRGCSRQITWRPTLTEARRVVVAALGLMAPLRGVQFAAQVYGDESHAIDCCFRPQPPSLHG